MQENRSLNIFQYFATTFQVGGKFVSYSIHRRKQTQNTTKWGK